MTMVETDPATGTIAATPSGETTRVSSIYLASTESDTGKSAIALGLLHLLAASAARVGVFRPIVRSTEETDYLLELLLEHATATLDTHGQCVGVTYARVREDPDAALSEIIADYRDGGVRVRTPFTADRVDKVGCPTMLTVTMVCAGLADQRGTRGRAAPGRGRLVIYRTGLQLRRRSGRVDLSRACHGPSPRVLPSKKVMTNACV